MRQKAAPRKGRNSMTDRNMRGMSRKRIRAARAELTKRGVLVDSGRKRLNPKTGKWEIVWMLNPNLTREQQEALAERPDTTQ